MNGSQGIYTLQGAFQRHAQNVGVPQIPCHCPHVDHLMTEMIVVQAKIPRIPARAQLIQPGSSGNDRSASGGPDRSAQDRSAPHEQRDAGQMDVSTIDLPLTLGPPPWQRAVKPSV